MKTYTEKELRLAQRRAFFTGIRFHTYDGRAPYEEAARKYPLPTITRPRVIDAEDARGNPVKLKIENGKVWRSGSRLGADEWYESWYGPAYYTAVAELAKNPTETVDA
jgi:hypothetical protein